jgi:hypothetical protein
MSGSDAFTASRWFAALRWLLDVKQGVRPLVVPIMDEQGDQLGELRPITVAHLQDEALLERFVVWRNQHRFGYLDQRPVTLAGVRRYVEDVVYNPTRVSFLAYCDGRPIARMGAVRIGPHEHESDGLVRGERGGGMQFVHRAQLTGMVLLFRALNQTSIISRVLSTNDLARESCTSLGYDMTPVVSAPVYRIRCVDGDTIETNGRAEELVDGVTLDTFRLDRRAFFERMSVKPGFQELDSLICEMSHQWKGGAT